MKTRLIQKLNIAAFFTTVLFAAAEANADVIIQFTPNSTDGASGNKNIQITDNAAKPGSPVWVQLTGNFPGGPNVPLGSGQRKNADSSGKATFTFPSKYTRNGQTATVTDYHEQYGDPIVLSAGAFDENGNLMPLADWLDANGYNSENNQIIQPDFSSTDGSQIYVAVDLAQLGGSGATFISTYSSGDILTVGANDMVPGLPGELFSSTLPVDAPGDGWSVTPLSPGTEVEFDSFHSTYVEDVPEPSSLALLGCGALGLAIRMLRCRN